MPKKKPSERIKELALEIGEKWYKERGPHEYPVPGQFSIAAVIQYLDEQEET